MQLSARAGTGLQAGQCFQQQRVSSRRIVSVRVEVPDAFRSALQEALNRDRSAESDFNSGGRSWGNSYGSDSRDSYGTDSRSSYGYASPPSASAAAAAAQNASPMLQILATALGQSRSTLERLQAEEAEIENLIQKEQKQVERLEWLLETVQKDYAYFNYLQQRFEEDSGRGSTQQQQQSRW
uniref:Uncharacterized protein n=1 Tax=Tetradesmus obliquus TaxID=3088 RepID=A0A383WFD1_TETOB|eukprot:jgi/Sobl393_1/7808/SZX76298.1